MRFVEPVNLVDKQNRTLAGILQPITGAGDDTADVGDIGLDTAEPLKFALRGVGDDFGQRSLTGAGRAVENDRTDPVGFDGPPKKFALGENVALTDKFFKRARSHPRGKGNVGR